MKERSEEYCLPGNQKIVENKIQPEHPMKYLVSWGSREDSWEEVYFWSLYIRRKTQKEEGKEGRKKPHDTMRWCKDLWPFYTVSIEITQEDMPLGVNWKELKPFLLPSQSDLSPQSLQTSLQRR